VITLVPFFPFFQVIPLPAIFMLGVWFVFQFVAGAISFGQGGGGVAVVGAHRRIRIRRGESAKITYPFRRRPESYAEVE
jgi:membrane associated rhomboid family serine protease